MQGPSAPNRSDDTLITRTRQQGNTAKSVIKHAREITVEKRRMILMFLCIIITYFIIIILLLLDINKTSVLYRITVAVIL